jgi:hypothetical protein
MLRKICVIAVCLCLFPCHGALADDVCTIVALHGVASVESPTTMMEAGDQRVSITQYRIEISTRIASFCQHGGYCWPETVTINGRSIRAVKLTNCSVDRQHPSSFSDYIFYELVPDRSKIPEAVMRESDVAQRLIELGMCDACAHHAAAIYVRKPETECGKLTKSVLEGNPDALVALRKSMSSGTSCQYSR